MRVFVTGGTGFVGRYVVRDLLGKGHEVILGVRNEGKARRLFGDKVSVFKVNFSDKSSVKSVLKGSKPEAIVHMIGILLEDRRKGITFERVHYLFSKNLYETANELGIKRTIHMSALGTHDSAPSRYHQTKRWAEKVLIDSGITYTIFRPSLILGPEQRLFYDIDRITRVIPVVALPGKGSYRFQPVDVRDVADCFVTALESSDTEGKIFELCGDRVVTFKELLEDIFSYWNRKVLMIPVPKAVMYYLGRIAELTLQPPPFSSDQILMMWRNNMCGILGNAVPNGMREILGREPVPYEKSLEWSLVELLGVDI